LEVVHVSFPADTQVSFVNSSLASFSASIETVIDLFPYCTYETLDEARESVVGSLRSRLVTIDPAALSHDSLWQTFLDDVYMGDYGEEWFLPPNSAGRCLDGHRDR